MRCNVRWAAGRTSHSEPRPTPLTAHSQREGPKACTTTTTTTTTGFVGYGVPHSAHDIHLDHLLQAHHQHVRRRSGPVQPLPQRWRVCAADVPGGHEHLERLGLFVGQRPQRDARAGKTDPLQVGAVAHILEHLWPEKHTARAAGGLGLRGWWRDSTHTIVKAASDASALGRGDGTC